MPNLAEQLRQDRYLIDGCMSRVWLVPTLRDSKVIFEADSDSAIVKGMLAVLLDVSNNNPPNEILGLDPAFLREVGITEHLSGNRRNGLSHFVTRYSYTPLRIKP